MNIFYLFLLIFWYHFATLLLIAEGTSPSLVGTTPTCAPATLLPSLDHYPSFSICVLGDGIAKNHHQGVVFIQ
ncbi:hypothetical protein L211DRAFT_655544 [Terfezia boudieri ATCC MYA-4762]|uniref:Secreted protein n=1 Tax=Terfezia boudieri ATCC MYA-4762 TaxID=1051890 RepID=A0A3N4M090_9PEZI|nr:hypothetical protein L211DRAFT_655544 [Terfezia boudieri ATCC MYA-4762]